MMQSPSMIAKLVSFLPTTEMARFQPENNTSVMKMRLIFTRQERDARGTRNHHDTEGKSHWLPARALIHCPTRPASSKATPNKARLVCGEAISRGGLCEKFWRSRTRSRDCEKKS